MCTPQPVRSETLTPPLAHFLPRVDRLPVSVRAQMRDAAREVAECVRVLRRGGLNLVGEVLRGQGDFFEDEHYPHDDVFDAESQAQYYYHAHRGPVEHGHFHTFMRAAGMPDDVVPLAPDSPGERPLGNDAICHLIAISMDGWGDPVGLFATNLWVTGETGYPAGDAMRMLDRFVIDHAWPSWPANRWIGAVLRLYRPWIAALLEHRDAVLAARMQHGPANNVIQDRTLEITGLLPVDPEHLASELGVTMPRPQRARA